MAFKPLSLHSVLSTTTPEENPTVSVSYSEQILLRSGKIQYSSSLVRDEYRICHVAFHVTSNGATLSCATQFIHAIELCEVSYAPTFQIADQNNPQKQQNQSLIPAEGCMF